MFWGFFLLSLRSEAIYLGCPYLFERHRVLSGGTIPQEAITVHNYCDHLCGMAQLLERLRLINQSFGSSAGEKHRVNGTVVDSLP